MDQATDNLAKWRHNIYLINQLIQNDVSSTKVGVTLFYYSTSCLSFLRFGSSSAEDFPSATCYPIRWLIILSKTVFTSTRQRQARLRTRVKNPLRGNLHRNPPSHSRHPAPVSMFSSSPIDNPQHKLGDRLKNPKGADTFQPFSTQWLRTFLGNPGWRRSSSAMQLIELKYLKPKQPTSVLFPAPMLNDGHSFSFCQCLVCMYRRLYHLISFLC